jgi:phosphoribosylglycinamide formyltransferase 1
MHSLVIFASGSGTNAQAIINYFKTSGKARVSLIVCNNPGAGVLLRAEKEGIPTLMIGKESIYGEEFLETLKTHNPTLIVLAGFLWKVPDAVIQAFPSKIINIHPALLPKYGGKGMYGDNVHKAVIASGEQESGITIHYVDEVYDRGAKILQAYCKTDNEDTVANLAQKIHLLEHFYYPRTIEYLLDNI